MVQTDPPHTPEHDPSHDDTDRTPDDGPADGATDAVATATGRDDAGDALVRLLPEEAALGVEKFSDLPLHERILEAVQKVGWNEPTPVQKLCLPFTLRGRDVAGFAQTGTGKTAVFLLTILNRLLEARSAAPEGAERVTRALVLAPTRELAIQIEQDAQDLFEHTGINSMAVFGGIDYDKQAQKIREGVDVIFATPGRLKDYVQKRVVDLQHISVFVCDEADRMFDMGFIEDVEFFLARIPESSQRLLFSATTNDQVKELAFEYLENPEYISVNPEVMTPEKIEQHAVHCHATAKLRVILGMLREHAPECSIIFTNTKLTAEWLHFKLLHNGIEADIITGDLPQKKRIELIHRIKEGKLKALIATDVASRGLHISRVTHVYNFDLPDDASNYVHRIGRTARAGARGFAYSLVCDDYGQNLADINELLGPALAMQSEWPNDEYQHIEDKAGNPFEDRYNRKREYSDGPRGDSAGRGDRPSFRGNSDRPVGRSDGGRPQPGGRSGPGGPQGRRPERGPDQQGRRPDRGPRPDQQPRHAQGDANGNVALAGDKKRRRRGKGGAGQEGGNRQDQPGQQPAGGRPGQQRSGAQTNQNGGRFQDQQRHGQKPATGAGQPVVAASDHGEVAPKSFGGMVKKLVKTMFGWGK